MPRIPTSKPQDVRSRPSVGGQVNIRSQDSFFRSIAAASQEAGQLFEQARVEKQNLLDKKAISEFNIWSDKSQKKLLVELEGIAHSESDKYLNDWLTKTTFNASVPASKEATEAMRLKENEMKQAAVSSAQVTMVRKLQAEVESLADIESKSIIENGGSVEDAMEPYDGIGWSNLKISETKAQLKLNVLKRDKSRLDAGYKLAIEQRDMDSVSERIDEMRNLGFLNSDEEEEFLKAQAVDIISKDITSESVASIDATRDYSEIEKVVNSVLDNQSLSEEYKDKIKKKGKSRKDTIARETYTFLGSQIALESGILSRIEKGEYFSDSEIDNQPIDEESKKLLKEIGKQVKVGGLGVKSNEYRQFGLKIEKMFADDPIGLVGIGEISSKQYNEIYNEIERGDWSTSAKLSLISTLLKFRAIDAGKDKDLFGFFETKETIDKGTVRKLNDIEIDVGKGGGEMLRLAGNDLSAKLVASDGKIDATKTGMLYTDVVDLFFKFQSPSVIEKFKDLEPGSKEFNDTYKATITDDIANKQKDTAIMLMRDRILGLKSQQAQEREKIISGY
jgi:hypothetical protein